MMQIQLPCVVIRTARQVYHYKQDNIALFLLTVLFLQTMNLLFSMRKDIEENRVENDNSELKKWLRLNGKDTVYKFLELEKSNFKKVLTFSG